MNVIIKELMLYKDILIAGYIACKTFEDEFDMPTFPLFSSIFMFPIIWFRYVIVEYSSNRSKDIKHKEK